MTTVTLSPTQATRWERVRALRMTTSGAITSLIGLFAAVMYTWGLASAGTANSYYTAAVKSATVSWKAFLFGSLDAGNFITVDKPPAALWVQALSCRLFGFSTFSMLLPEALCGVGSVLLVHRMVRRWMGDTAAHLAALALALTPVATLMFRYNNPDAFLTFLCVAGAAALWKAIESGRTRHLVVSAALIGLAFNTKMLQAFLVLPAFIAVYLWAGAPRLRRRILQLVAALGTLIVSAGWWIVLVALWPEASRPYIGSTDDNSIWSLLFGYNGLGRIFGGDGNTTGSGMGGSSSSGFGGASGWFRAFNTANGGQISWFLPLALVGLVVGLWSTRRAVRTSLQRAGFVLFGGWTVVSLLVFSLSSGIFHQYYWVQVAPAVAALAGGGAVALWRQGRQSLIARSVLSMVVVGSAVWSTTILGWTSDYYTWLRPVIIGAAGVAAAALWAGTHLRHKTMVIVGAVAATLALSAGPLVYSLTTVASNPAGPIVAAGPSTSGGMTAQGGDGTSSADSALIEYLESNQGSAKYLVATFTSNSSASIIIETGDAVVTIGGFNGSDPTPTLAEFKELIENGELKYVLISNSGGPSGENSDIEDWVTEHGTEVDYGGNSGTLYDVSSALS